MAEDWRTERLPALASRLAARPGHETVRTHLAELLSRGLGLRPGDLRQEDWRARVRGETASGSVGRDTRGLWPVRDRLRRRDRPGPTPTDLREKRNPRVACA